jgi:hypothetical protein
VIRSGLSDFRQAGGIKAVRAFLWFPEHGDGRMDGTDGESIERGPERRAAVRR